MPHCRKRCLIAGAVYGCSSDHNTLDFCFTAARISPAQPGVVAKRVIPGGADPIRRGWLRIFPTDRSGGRTRDSAAALLYFIL